LDALSKRLREDAQRLKEERTTLEGMIQSCDELILEMAEEYGLNRVGENDDNEDEDDDDEGNTIAPPALTLTVMPKEIIKEEDPVENGPHELDDLDDSCDLDEDLSEGCSDVEEWFPMMGVMIEIESSILSLSLGSRISF
jgi:hypothetical protein